MHDAPIIWQAVAGVWVNVGAQLVRRDSPVAGFADGDHAFRRRDFHLYAVDPAGHMRLLNFRSRNVTANAESQFGLASGEFDGFF